MAKMLKKILGMGHRSVSQWEQDTPSPYPTSFGASPSTTGQRPVWLWARRMLCREAEKPLTKRKKQVHTD